MSEVHRLSKLMSQRGLCSRREADKYIEQGLVRVNGERVSTLGIKFPEDVEIELTRDAKAQQAGRVTIMVNKPIGYVSGQAEDDYIPAIRLVTEERRSALCEDKRRFDPDHWQGLAPAGRLDIDSQGLLILTQDGRIAKDIIEQDTKLEKEYLVRIEGDVTEEKLEELRFGMVIDEKPLKPARVRELNEDQLMICLVEGKKRQIRRMCELVDLKVTGLKRVRIGGLRLGKLEEGEWRYVEPSEFRDYDKSQKYADDYPTAKKLSPKHATPYHEKRKPTESHSTEPKKSKETDIKKKPSFNPWATSSKINK